MDFNYDTTWIGILGGGVSGSIIGGGSVYQIDLWNMGGNRLPVRVFVTGKRVGLVAEVGTAHAMLIVTGCKTAQEMEGITSSGIDWEAKAILNEGAFVKTGAKLFKTVLAAAAAKVTDWAAQESAKRLVQFLTDDLGIVKPGKQFNLLPSPLSLSIGGGIFYEWQTLNLAAGNIGWMYSSPKWWMESYNGFIRMQMSEIPEQDGTPLRFGFSVPKWGLDPYIRWKKNKGEAHVDGRHAFQIVGYVYDGFLFERRDGMGIAGVNLTNFQQTGRLEEAVVSMPKYTSQVTTGGKLNVRPVVFQFANVQRWEADDTVEITLDSKGYFVNASDPLKIKS